MTVRLLVLLAAAAIVAGCEKEKGVGFTGIGKQPTQAAGSFYALQPVDGAVAE